MSGSASPTRRQRNKTSALRNLLIVSQEYKNNMVGKIFMYVFDNRFIEVNYKVKNFKHLTGVDSALSADQFYRNCINRTLTIEQFYFNARHPYHLAENKIRHLGNFYNACSSECFMQEDITTNSGTYKFGTTEMNFSTLFAEDIDEVTGEKRSDYYIVKSLRDKDCFDESSAVHSVTHIFVKNNDERKYSTVLYLDNNNKSNIPQEAKDKLDSSILALLV